MKKSPFIFTLLICASAQAGVINLGSIITDNISVLGYASAFPTTSSIAVTNVGSTINVTGNLVSPNLTGTSGVTFTAGSGTPAITATEENDLASVVTQLNSLSYTSLTLTAGTNTIATPGDYTINGTPPAGATINLTGNGTYVFKTTGNTALNLTNVTVNANGISSDQVFWYTTGTFTIKGGSIFGDVVLGSSAQPVLEAAAGDTPTTLKGRVLSEGFTTSIEAVQGAVLNINGFQAGAASVPEPASFAFVLFGLGALAAARRRR